MVRAYGKNGVEMTYPVDSSELLQAAWIDLVEPTEDEREAIRPLVRHGLALEEDADEIESSVKSFVDAVGVHVSTLFLHDVAGQPENTNVAVIVTADRLITMHDRDIPVIRLLHRRVRRRPTLLTDPMGLLLELFETAIEDLGDELQDLYRDLEETSRLVLEDETADLKDALDRLARHENLNGKLRLCLMDARRDLAFVLRSSQPGKLQAKRLKRLLSDIDALLPHNNHLFERVNFLLQAAQGFINIEQNQIIKIFSVAAVVFLPPTLIASIYGMNFQHMPELYWLIGYPLSLGLMVISAVLPYLFFKRKGWL